MRHVWTSSRRTTVVAVGTDAASRSRPGRASPDSRHGGRPTPASPVWAQGVSAVSPTFGRPRCVVQELLAPGGSKPGRDWAVLGRYVRHPSRGGGLHGRGRPCGQRARRTPWMAASPAPPRTTSTTRDTVSRRLANNRPGSHASNRAGDVMRLLCTNNEWSWGESNPRPSSGCRPRYDHSRELRLYGCRTAGSVGPAGGPPPGLSLRPAVFPTVSGLSRRQPPLLLPGCGDQAPRAITGRWCSLTPELGQAARAYCSSAVVFVPRLRSLSNSGRTIRLPVSTSKPISPLSSSSTSVPVRPCVPDRAHHIRCSLDEGARGQPGRSSGDQDGGEP
jgi:hypothetical protein